MTQSIDLMNEIRKTQQKKREKEDESKNGQGDIKTTEIFNDGA